MGQPIIVRKSRAAGLNPVRCCTSHLRGAAAYNFRHETSFSYPDFKDWQSENRSFTLLTGYLNDRFNLTGLDEPLRLRVLLVSHGYFDIMGVAPLHGRFFSSEENQLTLDDVLVLLDWAVQAEVLTLK